MSFTVAVIVDGKIKDYSILFTCSTNKSNMEFSTEISTEIDQFTLHDFPCGPRKFSNSYLHGYNRHVAQKISFLINTLSNVRGVFIGICFSLAMVIHDIGRQSTSQMDPSKRLIIDLQ